MKYVILGQMEQLYNAAVGMPKFEQMASAGILKQVFKNDGVIIYEVTQN